MTAGVLKWQWMQGERETNKQTNTVCVWGCVAYIGEWRRHEDRAAAAVSPAWKQMQWGSELRARWGSVDRVLCCRGETETDQRWQETNPVCSVISGSQTLLPVPDSQTLSILFISFTRRLRCFSISLLFISALCLKCLVNQWLIIIKIRSIVFL